MKIFNYDFDEGELLSPDKWKEKLTSSYVEAIIEDYGLDFHRRKSHYEGMSQVEAFSMYLTEMFAFQIGEDDDEAISFVEFINNNSDEKHANALFQAVIHIIKLNFKIQTWLNL